MSVSEHSLEVYGEHFIVALESLGRCLNLYPANHPAVGAQCKRFVEKIAELRDKTGDSVVNFVRGEMYVNGVPLKRLSLQFQEQIQGWERRGIGLLNFSPELQPAGVIALYEIMSLERREILERGGVGQALEAAGVLGIHAARVTVGVEADALSAVDGDVASAPEPDEEALDPKVTKERYSAAFMRLLTAVQAASDVDSRVRMVRSLSQQIESKLFERSAVRELATRLREHDKESYRHALGGAVGSILIGSALGLSQQRLRLLGEAAILRDVGKIRIKPEILQAGPDAEETAAEYRRHPTIGAKILIQARGIDPSAAIVALEHHAQFDLKGYPKLTARRSLHAYSRVVSVSSDYDRFTGGYPGAPYVSVWDAVGMLIQGAGSSYDPSALRGFLHIMGCVPEGSPLKLIDGREGIAAGTGQKTWLCPEVAILRDAQGNDVEPEIIDTDGLAPDGESIVLSYMHVADADRKRLEVLRDRD